MPVCSIWTLVFVAVGPQQFVMPCCSLIRHTGLSSSYHDLTGVDRTLDSLTEAQLGKLHELGTRHTPSLCQPS